ncbi:MAG: hypothetical protein ACHQ1E_08905 [Ktedonobacterales bacterium]
MASRQGDTWDSDSGHDTHRWRNNVGDGVTGAWWNQYGSVRDAYSSQYDQKHRRALKIVWKITRQRTSALDGHSIGISRTYRTLDASELLV